MLWQCNTTSQHKPKQKGKKKEKGWLSLEWRKEKRKNLYIGSLRIFLLGQISIDNNAKCIRSINYLICKSHLKLEIMKINFQQKHNGSYF